MLCESKNIGMKGAYAVKCEVFKYQIFDFRDAIELSQHNRLKNTSSLQNLITRN